MGNGILTVGSGTAKNRIDPPFSTLSNAVKAAGVAPVQTMTWSAKCPSLMILRFCGMFSFAFIVFVLR